MSRFWQFAWHNTQNARAGVVPLTRALIPCAAPPVAALFQTIRFSLQRDQLIGHIAQADGFRMLQLTVPVGGGMDSLERIAVGVLILANDA